MTDPEIAAPPSVATRTTAPSPPTPQVQIEIKNIYEYIKGPTSLDVTSTHYANFALVTFGPRDAWIDFLELPGVPRDGKNSIPSTRVYLSHVNAVRLAEAILQIYKQVRANNAIEQLPNP